MNTPTTSGSYGMRLIDFAEINFGHLQYEGSAKRQYSKHRNNLHWSDEEKRRIAVMLFTDKIRPCEVLRRINKKGQRSHMAAYTMVFRIKSGIVKVPGYEGRK